MRKAPLLFESHNVGDSIAQDATVEFSHDGTMLAFSCGAEVFIVQVF